MRLTETETLVFASQVAGGLSYLAARGIVHRNISTRTVLLSAGNVVKISGLKYSRIFADPDLYAERLGSGALPIKVGFEIGRPLL